VLPVSLYSDLAFASGGAEEAATYAAEAAKREAIAAEDAAIAKLKSDPNEKDRGKTPAPPPGGGGPPSPSPASNAPPEGGQGYTRHACLANAEQVLAKAMEASVAGDLNGLNQLGATQAQQVGLGSGVGQKDVDAAASQAQQSGLTQGLKGGCKEMAAKAAEQAKKDCESHAKRVQQSNPSDAQAAIKSGQEFMQHAAAEAQRCAAHEQDAAGAREALEKNKSTFDKMKGALPIAALAGLAGLAAAMMGGKDDKKDENKAPEAPAAPEPSGPEPAGEPENPFADDKDECSTITDEDIKKQCYCAKDDYKETNSCSAVAEFDDKGSPPTTQDLVEGSSAQELQSENPATSQTTGTVPEGTPEWGGVGTGDSGSATFADNGSDTESGFGAPRTGGSGGTTSGGTIDDGGMIDTGTSNPEGAVFGSGGSNEFGGVGLGDDDGADFVEVSDGGDNASRALASGDRANAGSANGKSAGASNKAPASNGVKFTTPAISQGTLMKIDPCAAAPNSKACKDQAAAKQQQLHNQHSDLLSN